MTKVGSADLFFFFLFSSRSSYFSVRVCCKTRRALQAVRLYMYYRSFFAFCTIVCVETYVFVCVCVYLCFFLLLFGIVPFSLFERLSSFLFCFFIFFLLLLF